MDKYDWCIMCKHGKYWQDNLIEGQSYSFCPKHYQYFTRQSFVNCQNCLDFKQIKNMRPFGIGHICQKCSIKQLGISK